MSISHKTKFDKLILEHIAKHLFVFERNYAKRRNKLAFVQEEISKLDTLITKLHDSSSDLNNAFFEVQKMVERDIDLEFPQAIKQYFKNSVVKQNKLIKFSVNLLALYRMKNIFYEKTKSVVKQTTPSQEHETTDYTNARIVLTISYLLHEIYEKDNNNFVPDKTEIARFINALTLGKNTTNITNTNIYAKVKTLFGDPSKGGKTDLAYVREKFNSLGIETITKKIDLAINKKNKNN